MRFLITVNPKHPVPPEVAVVLSDAMLGWIGRLRESGKSEALWGFAGMAGGMGIYNVDSAEELNGVVAEIPFGPFSDVQVTALVDVVESVTRFKQVAQAMIPPGGGR